MEDAVVPGVRVETIHDLAAATARSDKVVSF
jgi:sulfur relay (sulfurtransferase) complex TusBCD TusD component (DsrE family)